MSKLNGEKKVNNRECGFRGSSLIKLAVKNIRRYINDDIDEYELILRIKNSWSQSDQEDHTVVTWGHSLPRPPHTIRLNNINIHFGIFSLLQSIYIEIENQNRLSFLFYWFWFSVLKADLSQCHKIDSTTVLIYGSLFTVAIILSKVSCADFINW